MDTSQENVPLVPKLSVKRSQQSKARFFISLGFVLIVFKGCEEMSLTCFKQYVYFWCEQYLNKTGDAAGNASKTDTAAANTSKGNAGDANSDDCNTNNASKTKEDDAQDMASQWQMYYDILNSVLVFISISVFGTLSDFIGRKKIGLLALFGFTMRCIIVTVVVYFDLHIAYFMVAIAIDGICGSHTTFSLYSYSSAADLTDNVRDRVMAVALIEGMVGTGLFSTDIATGYFIKRYDYFYPNLTSACGSFISLTLAGVLLRETNVYSPTLIQNIQTESQALRPTCSALFNNYIGFYTSKQQKGKRIFWLSLVVFFLLEVVIKGKSNPLTLYQLGRPFCWGSELIGWYGGANMAATYMIGVLALKPMLHVVSEHVAACVGIISSLAGNLITAMATSTMELFIEYLSVNYCAAPLIVSAIGAGFLGTMPKSIIRGMVSSRVAGDKQGAIFAGLQSSELICQLIAGPVCLSIYSHTLDTMRGGVFIVLAGVCGATLLVQLCLSCLLRREKRCKEVTITVDPTEPSLNT